MLTPMSSRPLRVAVLGPGGVGGLLAALLARGGDDVVVLAGAATVSEISHHGIRVESARFGDFTVAVRAATRLEDAVDVCFVTVKATQLQAALERVPADVLGDGLAVPMLNGFDHVDLLRSVYPPDSVAAATIRIETIRIGPGVIRQTSPFAAVEIAAGQENRERVERVAVALRKSGLDVRVRHDELAMLWDKFGMLGPLALLTTHEQGNLGAVRTRRRDDMTAVIGEVGAVAAAEGVTIDLQAVTRMVDSAPPQMSSSMERGQAADLPLELDALGGALLRKARKSGVPVPVTSRLVAEIASRAGRSASGDR